MPDVVVVGAGVMGASIALELQRSGRSVLVVDRGDAVGAGSTSASSAVVRFNYSTLAGVIAAWESAHRWADWARHLGADQREADSGSGPLARFVRCPMLFIQSPGFDRDGSTALLSEVGVPWEVLDKDQLAEQFPALDTGRFYPPRRPDDPRFGDDPSGRLDAVRILDSGFIDDPQLAATNLMDAARRLGTEVQLGTEVVKVRHANGGTGHAGRHTVGIVTADGREVDAPVVVNAAGPWSAGLNQLAGVFSGPDDGVAGNRPMRQEVHVVPAPSGFTLEDGGVMIADLDLGYYSRPQVGDTLLARRLPALAVPHRPTGLAGVYDVTPDWVPIYDRTSLDGFYVAIGTSGNQFKNAPLVGQILRDIIDACEVGHDHDADPVSTRCDRIGRDLDLGAFSRLRSIAETTGTVLG